MANAETDDDALFYRRVMMVWLVVLTVGLFWLGYIVNRFDMDTHKHVVQGIEDNGTTVQHVKEAEARIQALEKKVAELEAQKKATPPTKP